jgi:hypothetical protein
MVVVLVVVALVMVLDSVPPGSQRAPAAQTLLVETTWHQNPGTLPLWLFSTALGAGAESQISGASVPSQCKIRYEKM